MMTFTTKCVKAFMKAFKAILFRIKLHEMDEWWYLTGRSGWGLFPPSFYYTHTEEEIERIRAETIERIQKLIDQLD